jgi:hypothetical protein
MNRMNRATAAAAVLLSLTSPGLLAASLAPVNAEIPVSLQFTTQPLGPQVAFFPDGGFVVAWTVLPEPPFARPGVPPTLHARLFDGNGAATSGEFRLVKAANQRLDGVAAVADGFVALWDQTNSHGISSVWARRFQRSGAPASPAFKVHADSSLLHYGGRVAPAPDGGFAVAWSADNAPGQDPNFFSSTFARIFDAAGNPKTNEFLVSSGSATDHSQVAPAALAVAPDGTLAIVSQFAGDGVSLTLQRFHPDGTLLQELDPFLPACCEGTQFAPALTMAPDGQFVVAWATSLVGYPPAPIPSVILFRQFSAAGTALGGSVEQVNFRGRFESYPLLGALPGGGFVAAWTDLNGRDGSGDGIFGRTFNADGSAAGPDYRINLAATGDQLATSLAVSPTGEAVVVWVGQNLLGPQVRARLLR